MKTPLAFLVSVALAGSLAITACAPAPAASPTQPPAPPVKAAEPTKAAAAQPTAAPATAVPTKAAGFPEKGKTMTMIVPWVAGGANDVLARLVAAGMEKELGTQIAILNKAGASSQIGLTELAAAKPDGYTIALDCVPTTQTVLLDPTRKASISSKDLQPVAAVVADPVVLDVSVESPYKTAKDFIDAAKSSPGKIRVGSVGVMSSPHMAILQLQKVTGAEFTIVQFDGDPKGLMAVMAGDVDAHFANPASTLPQVKGGKIRALGHMGEKEFEVIPGIPTLRAQGYDVVWQVTRGFVVPGGTSKEIVAVLEKAVANTFKDPEFKKKTEELAMPLRYVTTADYVTLIADAEKQVKPLIAEAAAENGTKK